MNTLEDDEVDTIHITDPVCLLNESNDSPIFSNKSFFKGEPDCPTTTSSSSSSSGDVFKHIHKHNQRPKQKRESRFFTCKWCERNVTSLWFQVGCVPECSLAYFYDQFPELYNLAFIEICKISDFENDKLQPGCSPRRDNKIYETPEDYWQHIPREIYPNTFDPRIQILFKFIKENAVDKDCILDLSENTFAKKQ